jgi:N-acetylneuraminate lyase
MTENFTGLMAAPHTPFTPQGELNSSVVALQADALLRDGVKGAFIAGTTGEGASLTIAERMQLAESWIAARRDNLRVIVHVGHNALPDAITLARHARTIGADAIAAIAPNFFKPNGITELLDYLAPIAEAAPDVPFYYYHIPAMTGVDLPMVPFLERAAERLPNLRGIKYSEPDFTELQSLLAAAGKRYEILWGCDDVLLAALTYGVQGAVGSTYNHSAPLYLAMWEAFTAGNLAEARNISQVIVAMVDVLRIHGVIPTQKLLLEGCGIPVGPARPPLDLLSGLRATYLYQLFTEKGWFSPNPPT